MTAAVKGSAFLSVQADVRRLVDAGQIDLDEVAADLSDKDRGCLDAYVTPVTWVPMETYGRLLALLARVEGGKDPIAYLRKRGREAARRLLGGAYQGFAKASGALDLRGIQIVIGVARMLYNFMTWEARTLPDQSFEITVREAADYPDAALHTAEGFLELYGELTTGVVPTVMSERQAPGEIVIIVRPVLRAA